MSKTKESPRILPSSLHLPLTGVDSHAHLDSAGLIERLPEVMEQARQAGVACIGQVFLSLTAYREYRSAFTPYPGVFFLMGGHPSDAQACTPEIVQAMRMAFQGDPTLKAVGEIGLDFYWHNTPHSIQEEAFSLQLALAVELDLPVVIHSRDAARDSLRILEAEGFSGRPLLWHCFSGDAVPLLDRILANGWHVSIPGPVTYPANQALRDAVARIPQDRLLVETDCPYLAPVPWRGTQNEPALAVFTAATVAEIRGMAPEELWTACGRNAMHFFHVAASD